MPDYSKAKIYKIVCNTTGEQYFGSTIQPLSTRLGEHKRTLKYSSSEIIKRNNFEIILCENYPCNNREELVSRERFWIENNDCVNLRIPIISAIERKDYEKKWYKSTIQKRKEQSNQYYINNKKKILERQKKWYEENKEEILRKRKENKNKKSQLINEDNTSINNKIN